MREKMPGEIIALHEKKELGQYSPAELRKFKSILSKHISKTNDLVVKSKGKQAIEYIGELTGKRDYKEKAVVDYDSLSMSRKALALSVIAIVISSIGTLWVILERFISKP